MARSKRGEQTRGALIEAGIAQLSAHGYHGTGIKQILDAVQVPKGSFYNYFDSKEAFVAEIITEYSDGFLDDLDRTIRESVQGPLDTLHTVFEQAIRKYEAQDCARSCLVGSLAAEIGHHSALCQQAMHQAARQWEERLVPLLADGQKAGEVRSDLTAEQLARIVWSCWEGAMIRMKLEGSGSPARDVMTNLLRGVLKS